MYPGFRCNTNRYYSKCDTRITVFTKRSAFDLSPNLIPSLG